MTYVKHPPGFTPAPNWWNGPRERVVLQMHISAATKSIYYLSKMNQPVSGTSYVTHLRFWNSDKYPGNGPADKLFTVGIKCTRIVEGGMKLL